MEGVILLEEKSKEHEEDLYDGAPEIDIDGQNTNLMLTSDHKYKDPLERPLWRGMVVYLNELGYPHTKIMRWIKVDRFKNLMKERNIDVTVVHLSLMFKSTQ
jgi:hypothetical protein